MDGIVGAVVVLGVWIGYSAYVYHRNTQRRADIDRWCARVSEVPPPDRDGPGAQPASMTPAQQDTWDAQRDPSNRWTIHPDIEGCVPREPAIR